MRLSKYQGDETLQDYRRRRTRWRQSQERTVKTHIRTRDGIGCRWPGCEFWKQGYRVDAAHVEAKGIGGDKRLYRTTTANLIRLCIRHHLGPFSLHSGDLRIVALTERGADGPVQFEVRDPKAPEGWRVEGVEDDFTFQARRDDAAGDRDEDGA